MSNVDSSGNIIGVKPGMLQKYIELHDKQPDEIRSILKNSGCLKCDIFLAEIDGKEYLFQYVEVDLDKRRADLYETPAYREWARVTGECQLSLDGAKLWKNLKHVYTLEKQ